jgi:hypothetical protein
MGMFSVANEREVWYSNSYCPSRNFYVVVNGFSKEVR